MIIPYSTVHSPMLVYKPLPHFFGVFENVLHSCISPYPSEALIQDGDMNGIGGGYGAKLKKQRKR